MVKEKHKFLLRARIKEPKTDDGIIKDLEQEFELEVNWNDRQPSEGKIERQIVEFKKDGKSYNFEIECEIKKGWFKDKVRGSSFGISGELSKQNFSLESMGGKAQVVPLQTRITGWFWLGGFLLLLCIVIGGYLFWKKKQK